MWLLVSAILGGVVALVLFKLLVGTQPSGPPLPRPQTRYTTVYIFPGGEASRPLVNAAPETLFVRGGDQVEWTVVDATGGPPAQVSFRIKEGKDPFEDRLEPFTRRSLKRLRGDAFRTKGESVRYAILVNGVELFDPELIMDE